MYKYMYNYNVNKNNVTIEIKYSQSTGLNWLMRESVEGIYQQLLSNVRVKCMM